MRKNVAVAVASGGARMQAHSFAATRFLVAAVVCAAGSYAADDVPMRAMRDELARSMKKLQLENLQKPYFIAYRMVENSGCTASASFGAIVLSTCQSAGESPVRRRNMGFEVR